MPVLLGILRMVSGDLTLMHLFIAKVSWLKRGGRGDEGAVHHTLQLNRTAGSPYPLRATLKKFYTTEFSEGKSRSILAQACGAEFGWPGLTPDKQYSAHTRIISRRLSK